MTAIPYSHQKIDADDVRAVAEVLRSDWLTQGPKVQEFEQAFARTVGARFAVALSSGTAALHAAYFAAGIGKGDEIISAPITFPATTNAALWQGATPVFADIDERTGNIDPEDVKRKITKRARAIVPIDYSGLPARLGELREIARQHKLLVIEDAAQALGARYRGKMIGSISDMTIFSFHPVKSITTGEGGAVATDRKDFYERMCIFRTHGVTRDLRRLTKKKEGPWYFEMQELGMNYRLTDIQAALGISQLKKLSRFIKERREIAERYHHALSGLEGIILPLQDTQEMQSAWHLYPIRLAGSIAKKRAAIFKALREVGIGVQVHHIPVHLHPYYKKLGFHTGIFPRAERFYESEISLPIFPGLTFKDQKHVIATLQRILRDI